MTSLSSLVHKPDLLFNIWIFLKEITRISDITERFVYYTVRKVSDENQANLREGSRSIRNCVCLFNKSLWFTHRISVSCYLRYKCIPLRWGEAFIGEGGVGLHCQVHAPSPLLVRFFFCFICTLCMTFQLHASAAVTGGMGYTRGLIRQTQLEQHPSMAVVVGGIRPLTGKFTIMFSYKGRRGGRGLIVQTQLEKHPLMAVVVGIRPLVCVFFVCLPGGGVSQSIFKHLHPSGVGKGGGYRVWLPRTAGEAPRSRGGGCVWHQISL